MVLTAAQDNIAKIWSVDGQLLKTLSGHRDWLTSARFSHNDRRVVTASVDGTVRLWDVATGRQVQSVGGHYGVIRSAAFSPDDQHIVTADMSRMAYATDVSVSGLSRWELLDYACAMGALANGNDRFTGDELERTPVLDAATDLRACRPPNVLSRFARVLGGASRVAPAPSPQAAPDGE
jgi:hypothetical protein